MARFIGESRSAVEGLRKIGKEIAELTHGGMREFTAGRIRPNDSGSVSVFQLDPQLDQS